jgi:hypothetical protein
MYFNRWLPIFQRNISQQVGNCQPDCMLSYRGNPIILSQDADCITISGVSVCVCVCVCVCNTHIQFVISCIINIIRTACVCLCNPCSLSYLVPKVLLCFYVGNKKRHSLVSVKTAESFHTKFLYVFFVTRD